MGLYTPLDDNLVRYHGLMRVWHDDTCFLSGAYQRHASFNEIVALKDKIPLVQLLLDDLGEYCHLCFHVLWTIIPNPPEVPEKDKGRVQKLVDLWVKWGSDNGYRTFPVKIK
jgi:hypothetical protein